MLPSRARAANRAWHAYPDRRRYVYAAGCQRHSNSLTTSHASPCTARPQSSHAPSLTHLKITGSQPLPTNMGWPALHQGAECRHGRTDRRSNHLRWPEGQRWWRVWLAVGRPKLQHLPVLPEHTTIPSTHQQAAQHLLCTASNTEEAALSELLAARSATCKSSRSKRHSCIIPKRDNTSERCSTGSPATAKDSLLCFGPRVQSVSAKLMSPLHALGNCASVRARARPAVAVCCRWGESCMRQPAVSACTQTGNEINFSCLI